MSRIRLFVIIVFFALIIVPIITMDTRKEVVSEIDNRKLAEDPYSVWEKSKTTGEKFDLNTSITSYLSDRIGFRKEMLLAYTEIYDKVFHEMKHPMYIYGKEGFVFSHITQNIEYSHFHDNYVKMMKNIKQFCDDRGVPCYFMFNPSKVTVLQQYLPEGVNFNREWADRMLENMRNEGIKVVDNTELLIKLESEGKGVFNKKYNAGHWNDLGAYYGVNNLLSTMKRDGIGVTENQLNDFDIKEEERISLQVSEFPIYDTEPVFYAHDKTQDISSDYTEEVVRDSRYREFHYRKNSNKSNTPRLLIFQGSYINGMGYKFLANAFSEYVAVHDYQNTISFDYYYNIFKPDVVVIEVAEYACNDSYFSMSAMENMKLNPVLNLESVTNEIEVSELGIMLEKGKTLTKISTHEALLQVAKQAFSLKNVSNVYLQVNDNIFDFRLDPTYGEVYACTLDNKYLEDNSKLSVIIANDTNAVRIKAPLVKNILESQVTTSGVRQNNDSFIISTSVPNNAFSNAVLQIQNSETGKLMEPQGVKNSVDEDVASMRTYTHNEESGLYDIRYKAVSNLSDEYVSYKVYLEKGKTYYYRYRLDKLSTKEMIISGLFFGG